MAVQEKARSTVAQSLLLRMFKRGKSSLAGELQRGNVPFDGSVHELEIDAQVVVHQDVPKPSQPLPVDRRLRGLDTFGQLLARLGQCLQVSDHTILNQVRP